MIKVIAFDADDTLWHNERIFLETKEKYKAMLAPYHDGDWIEKHLDEMESRNIRHFGYGVKGFTLSMIETACDLTNGEIKGSEIKNIISFARQMLNSPIDLLDGVKETIHALSHQYRLMIITKGDLFDQETKIARSGLGDYFEMVEIVAQKNREAYEKILARYDIKPPEFAMIGNSLKSDILPVAQIGAKAVYIKYETEWFHEMVSDEELKEVDYLSIEKMSDLIALLAESREHLS